MKIEQISKKVCKGTKKHRFLFHEELRKSEEHIINVHINSHIYLI